MNRVSPRIGGALELPPSSRLPGPVLGSLWLYVTQRCNLRCSHCWVSAGATTSEELTTEEVRGLLADSAELGARSIKITGGEPFCREDISGIVKAAKDCGFTHIGIETNGTLIDPKILPELKRAGVGLGVSVDGMSEEVHDKFRGVPGALRRTKKAISNIIRTGIPLEIITVANKMNLDEIPKLVRWSASVGVSLYRVIPSITPIGRGKEAKEELGLSILQTRKLLKQMFAFNRIYGGRVAVHAPLALTPTPLISHSNMCGWGTSMCGVLSGGDVSICGVGFEEEDMIAGNIRRKGLRKIWTNSSFFKMLRSIKPSDLLGVCGNCEANRICRGQCRVSAYATYGDIKAPEPLCQEFYSAGFFPKYALINPRRDCHYS